MTLNLVLILVGWLGLGYLIYRYARYSPWRSTIIGQSFMMMKTALWALFTFVLVARLFPDWEGRKLISAALLLFVVVAIIWQTAVVVKLQGGLRRNGGKTTGTEGSHPEVRARM